jgi:aspartate/glutamate racemase
VIIGCTEVPIMLAGQVDEDDPTLINPTALIAEAAVRHAIG